MNFRLPILAVPLALLFPVGWAMRNLEPKVAATHATLRTGHRVVLPVLFDGLRPAVAGGCWLRAYLAWEKRDAPAMVAWLEATVAADERPAYFWLNGARMIAYDLPAWTSGPDRTRDEVSARQALGFLETGLRWRGDDPQLLIEMANIHLHCLGDLQQAAGCYRRAAEQPGAPYYAARLHAELLVALGRPQEALAWLRRVLPTLPAEDAAARREGVAARIRTLERTAGLP